MSNFANSLNFDLIRYPLLTDKSTRLIPQNQYSVIVDPKATKEEIKKVFESLFGVSVIKINTCNLPKKSRKVGKYKGTKPKYKKAFLTISRDNDTPINLFSSPSDKNTNSLRPQENSTDNNINT